MILCKLLVLIFTFNELLVHLDAVTCPKGQRVSTSGKHCEACPDGYFQPHENDSKLCKLCTKCDENSWSVVKQKCTKTTDTVCQCVGDSVPWDDDSSMCKCDKGAGVKRTYEDLKVCSKCEEGYFSTKSEAVCQKWKDCKSAGEKRKGSSTSDVICNEEPNTHMSTATTSHISDFLTHSMSHPPHEGTRTLRMLTAITTTAAPRVTSPGKVQPPSSPSNPFGVAPPILVIAAILLLAAVTCKLYSFPCRWGKTPTKKKDSCSKPVEESGVDSRSSLKEHPEEP